MRLFPRSKKRRVIKKWFKRTGWIKTKSYIIIDGVHWYKMPRYLKLPIEMKFERYKDAAGFYNSHHKEYNISYQEDSDATSSHSPAPK